VVSLSSSVCLCNNSNGSDMAMGTTIQRLAWSRVHFLALSVYGLANAAVNNDAPAYEIKFNDTASVGPDGEYRFDAV
jgi:hypothetical protein